MSGESEGRTVLVWKRSRRGYNILYMDPHETSPRDPRWGWTSIKQRWLRCDALSYANRTNLAPCPSRPSSLHRVRISLRPGAEYPVAARRRRDHASNGTGRYSYEWFYSGSRASTDALLRGSGPQPVPFRAREHFASVLYLKARSLRPLARIVGRSLGRSGRNSPF